MEIALKKIMTAALELEKQAPVILHGSTVPADNPRMAMKRMDEMAGSIDEAYGTLRGVLDDIKQQFKNR